jgi:hypothetical protein
MRAIIYNISGEITVVEGSSIELRHGRELETSTYESRYKGGEWVGEYVGNVYSLRDVVKVEIIL